MSQFPQILNHPIERGADVQFTDGGLACDAADFAGLGGVVEDCLERFLQVLFGRLGPAVALYIQPAKERRGRVFGLGEGFDVDEERV